MVLRHDVDKLNIINRPGQSTACPQWCCALWRWPFSRHSGSRWRGTAGEWHLGTHGDKRQILTSALLLICSCALLFGFVLLNLSSSTLMLRAQAMHFHLRRFIFHYLHDFLLHSTTQQAYNYYLRMKFVSGLTQRHYGEVFASELAGDGDLLP